MEILAPYIDVKLVPYGHKYVRILIYAFVGFILVYISEPGSWATLHTSDFYPIALLLSMSLAVAIGEYIQYFTRYLDKHKSWLSGMRRRWVLQLLSCVVVPVGVVVLVYYFYFKANGYAFTQTTYMERILGLLIAMFISVSLYYQMRFSNFINKIYAKEKHKKKELTAANKALALAREKAQLQAYKVAQKKLLKDTVLQIKDIMLIYALGKVVLYCTKTTTNATWDFTITDTMATLPKQDFYLVSKGVIIAKSNILAVYQFTDTTYEVELFYPTKRVVTVSQRKRKAFNLWYGLQILPKRKKSVEAA